MDAGYCTTPMGLLARLCKAIGREIEHADRRVGVDADGTRKPPALVVSLAEAHVLERIRNQNRIPRTCFGASKNSCSNPIFGDQPPKLAICWQMTLWSSEARVASSVNQS